MFLVDREECIAIEVRQVLEIKSVKENWFVNWTGPRMWNSHWPWVYYNP